MTLGKTGDGSVSCIDFHKENEEKKCLDVEERPHRLTDEAAKRIIVKLSKCNNITEFQRLDTKKRDKLISEFKKRGISIRQISRLTGTSKGIVEKT